MKNGVNKRVLEPLHPFASRYDYVGGPVVGEGIFQGKQTSPWIKVHQPSDWYRGPWQIDRTQRGQFRRQPRPLEMVDRGAGYNVSPGTGVSGCTACGGLGSWSLEPWKTPAIIAGVVILGWWLSRR